MSSAAIMMITCPSVAVAKKLARSAVKSRLAACGNIIPGMTSIYEWKGRRATIANVNYSYF
jgi:periplasmic divalent cation tolerance protein